MPTGVHLRDVREQLFDAAERLLLEGGPSALTSRAVTTEAGVAKGVLHKHFDDFDGFLAEFVLDRVDKMDARAKALLASAGYKDTNGDGYVENKDGSAIDLKIVCPNGWSDWMTAIQVISDSAKAVGIKVTPSYPEYATLVDDRGHARYDLLLANDRQYSNTPWTYYQYIYQLPILDNQANVNYERFTSPSAWNTV